MQNKFGNYTTIKITVSEGKEPFYTVGYVYLFSLYNV